MKRMVRFRLFLFLSALIAVISTGSAFCGTLLNVTVPVDVYTGLIALVSIGVVQGIKYLTSIQGKAARYIVFGLNLLGAVVEGFASSPGANIGSVLIPAITSGIIGGFGATLTFDATKFTTNLFTAVGVKQGK